MFIDELRRQVKTFSLAAYGSGVTDDEIRKAESTLGLSIRGTYAEFLQAFGWLTVESIEILGLGTDVPAYLNLVKVTLEERYRFKPEMAHQLIPFLNDGAGNYYCLDASMPLAPGEPAVVFWNHDESAEQRPEFVSGSFAEWMRHRLATMHSPES